MRDGSLKGGMEMYESALHRPGYTPGLAQAPLASGGSTLKDKHAYPSYSLSSRREMRRSDASHTLRRVSLRCSRPLRLRLSCSTESAAFRSSASSSDNANSPDLPVQLLTRCLALSLSMAGLGFTLAVVGILAYAWMTMPRSIGVFSVVCFVGCVFASVVAIL